MLCSAWRMSLRVPPATPSRRRARVVDRPELLQPRHVGPSPMRRYGDQLFPKTGDAGALVPSRGDVQSPPTVLWLCCRTEVRRSTCLPGSPASAENLTPP